VADSLIGGKVLKIDGGRFEMAISRFRCNDFGHEWEVPFETMTTNPPSACPECNSPNIQPIYPAGFNLRRGGQRRGKRGW
jgi:predicted Zn-ribbon and HTH transcriptional regulator